jgi:NAD(P)-dependent dehydrogenase (short-subunit alcohol dehydrogenase family)
MPSVLITGANRGIGLELAAQYRDDGWTVHACCRAPDKAESLRSLAGERLHVHRMDVDAPGDIAAVAAALAEVHDNAPLDLLINNAGIIDNYGVGVAEGKDDPDIRNYDFDLWERVMRTNLYAPARITGAFLDNLRAAEKPIVVMVASGLSSIANTRQGGRYAYRTSKAALNMLMRGFAAWLEPAGVIVVSIAPGWTRTELGGPNAPNPVDVSVAGMRKTIAGLTLEKTGTYWDWDGTALPW